MRDYHTQDGATILANKIRQYWIDREYDGILLSITPARVRDNWGRDLVERNNFWIIKSNIGPLGYPPKERQCIA